MIFVRKKVALPAKAASRIATYKTRVFFVHAVLYVVALTFIWWALLPARAQAYVDPS